MIKANRAELEKIGFDSSYARQGADKHRFLSLKIYSLSPAQANIIKQAALAGGSDAAVHREVITGKIEKSDCILSGSLSELKKIAEKLSCQPFKLGILGKKILELIEIQPEPIKIRNTVFDWERPYIMGILNVTPDSFSDGGEFFDTKKAVLHAGDLIENGADIIDIGGESTRPYAQKVDVNEEIRRVVPVIEQIRALFPEMPVSIDTRNSKTAKAAFYAGADIINDVSAMEWDSKMKKTALELDVPVVLNHSKGTPENMQENPQYFDISEEIYDYFARKINELTEYGFLKKNLIIDPGIGFGKTKEQNFELLKSVATLKSLGCPLLVGHSRKTFLKEQIGSENIADLDRATNIISSYLVNEGVNFLRVHNAGDLKMLLDLNRALF